MDSMETRSEVTKLAPAVGAKGLNVFAHRVGLYFVVIAFLLVVAVMAGVAIGSSPIAADKVVRVLVSHVVPNGWIDLSSISEPERVVIWLIRTPRVFAAAIVGASLGVAGAQMQGL